MKNAGFTLIELLVVVSIIGMLSTVVAVSVFEARNKGQVGGAAIFATHTHHALGDDMFFDWNFDDPTTGSATDISGNGYTGTLVGSATKDPYDTPLGHGSSLDLPADGSYVLYNTSGSGIDFSDGGSGLRKHTVSVWIKPNAAMEDSTTRKFGGIVVNMGDYPYTGTSPCWNNRCVNVDIFYKNGSYMITGGYPTPSTYSSPEPTWSISEVPIPIISERWSHIAYTYDGSMFTLYVNGKQIGKYGPFTGMSCYGQCIINKILVGSLLNTFAGSVNFIGNVDDVVVYNSSLSQSDVERIYAVGVSRFRLARK